MNFMYRDLKNKLHTVVEETLTEIGLKNFKITDFSSGATYSTPETINFKIHTGDSDGPVYYSINTKTRAKRNDGKYEFSTKVSTNVTEDYTVNHLNYHPALGSSHGSNRTLDEVTEQDLYLLGSVPVIDIRKYGARWNGYNWHGTDIEAEGEYTKQTGSTLTKVDGNYIDAKDAELIMNKVVSSVHDYVVDNKEVIKAYATLDMSKGNPEKFKKPAAGKKGATKSRADVAKDVLNVDDSAKTPDGLEGPNT